MLSFFFLRGTFDLIFFFFVGDRLSRPKNKKEGVRKLVSIKNEEIVSALSRLYTNMFLK